MRLRFNDGTLKVSVNCYEWFKEKRSYYWDYNSRTGTVKPNGQDHSIDASRYAVVGGLLNNKYCLWHERGNLYNSQLQSYDTVQFNYI